LHKRENVYLIPSKGYFFSVKIDEIDMEVDIYNIKGEKTGSIKLSEVIFNEEKRVDIVHEVFIAMKSARRSGSASTKARSDVRGGGRKPWRQKGTGRARHGTIRSPIWRGGGITFGPSPRDYAKNIPKKLKKFALFSVLSDRYSTGKIFVVDNIPIEDYKTKFIADCLKNLKLTEGKTLIVTDEYNPFLFKSVDNLVNADVIDFRRLSTYEVVLHDNILFTKKAIEQFEEVRGNG
jgi:large subunit ribosomal protein L4